MPIRLPTLSLILVLHLPAPLWPQHPPCVGTHRPTVAILPFELAVDDSLSRAVVTKVAVELWRVACEQKRLGLVSRDPGRDTV